MTDKPQSWETEEEAMAALHAYASQYAEREEDPDKYEVFLSGHQILDLGDKYVLALKPGVFPFTYA